MGRVRQTGDNLNIQVNLVDANTGAQLWGREYESKSSDVLLVKQDIAPEVTDRLRLRLSGKVDPQAGGRELNVRAVLMGRVHQVGEGLNIQVDLMDASTGAQLWGKDYNRKISDVLAVKQEISREITEKLRLRLSGEEQKQLTRHDTTDAEAYQFYLRGRYYWKKRTTDGIKRAMGEFQKAIERDPVYALGYVGLADCYMLLEEHAGVPARESLPKARAAVDPALQIDDSLAEAHTSSAMVDQLYGAGRKPKGSTGGPSASTQTIRRRTSGTPITYADLVSRMLQP
jgi:TolB-like protein